MTTRRKKYQPAGSGMRKFAVKKGVYYAFSPVKHSNSKKSAQKWSKQQKQARPTTRHRIVKNSPKKYGKTKNKYTVYQTYYP